MRGRLMRLFALAVATSLFSTGCMLSRLVDRAFLGITVRRPTYAERKTTGVFLLPFTFAVDVATFPIQALLVVILGDNFPFVEKNTMNNALASNEQFQQLDPAAQAVALAELEALVRSGQLSPTTALVLSQDGHWSLVQLDDEHRAALIARAEQLHEQGPVCEQPQLALAGQ